MLLRINGHTQAADDAQVCHPQEMATRTHSRQLVDCHVHLLPGVDDGARSLEEALAMARLAIEDGITAAVVTPHHFNGSYSNEAQLIREQVATLKHELSAAGIPLDIYPGSELHLVPELPDALRTGKAMTFGDWGKAALVELPVHHIPIGTQQILESCLMQGITPVIAHPERNAQLCERLQILEDWIAMGCLAQVTVQSCTGRFGSRIQQAARRMVETRLIHIAASDGHRPYNRVPQMAEGRSVIAEWTDEDTADLLTSVYPRSLLRGERMDTALLLVPVKRPWWRRLCG
jgi:protein-tyrosine phosphatase